MRVRRFHCVALSLFLGPLGCGASGTGGAAGRGGASSGGTAGSGGVTSSGGVSGNGGTTGYGGVAGSGGRGSGGATGSSGTIGSGGVTGSGGATSMAGSGGATSPGGVSGRGGVAGNGGVTGTGGRGSGGATGNGGASGSGGTPHPDAATDSGAANGSGGVNGSGGAAGAGGTTGAGGTVDDLCPPVDAGVITGSISNSGPWNDTTGKHIQAHGGGLIKVCDTWYWFGEDKTLNTNGTGNFHAISCYASKDLANWEHRNSVVTTSTDPVLSNVNLIIERPKVIYNASTKLYVMWAHWDMEACTGASGGYCDSEAVVFTSPTVDGNYTYVKHFQPGGGNSSRDCTLWQEPDGTAYFVSTGGPGGNAGGDFRDTEVYQLSSDYLNVQNTTKIWASTTREAYAFWKDNGKYYGISSAQTGWAPNQAAYLTSTGSITGPWSSSFVAVGANGSTWSSQPTYVIPIVGSQTTTYIYAGDIWNSSNLSLSTYLWLPFTFDGTTWHLTYSAQWSINLATGVVSTN